MEILGSKLATAILEVNDASFRWYAAGTLLAWLVDWIGKGWLEKIGVPLGGLIIFVLVSGVLKLLYHIEGVICWLNAFRNDIRSEGFLMRVLAGSILFIELILNAAADRILAGKTLAKQLPALATAGFLWLLIVYLALLIVEEFKKGWTQAYLHIELNILFVLVIFLGAVAIVLNKERKAVSLEHVILGRYNGWKEYGFIGILSAGGAGVAYFKLKEFGWIGVAVTVFAGVLIFLLSFFVLTDQEDEYVR